MVDRPNQFTVSITDRISNIDADAWDGCLLETPGGDDHPFLQHAHLRILEDCRAIEGRIWAARYLTARDAAGRLVAAMPMFVKASPFGDLVNEQAWVDLHRRSGRPYYPKLQICAPFSPVTGPRLLRRRDAPEQLLSRIIGLVTRSAASSNLSGAHATYVTEGDLNLFKKAGWHVRSNMQFHWQNQDYQSFDDFLGTLISRRRSMIRSERQEVAQRGVDIQILTGPDLREEHMDVFAGFYLSTFKKKNCLPLLPRDYFLMLGERMADRVVLVMARADGRYVGATLNILGNRTLFSRSWGGVEGFSFLHFEVTNYRAIEFAIERGLATLDGGIGGLHKLKRGYQPVTTWSAHHMMDPAMDKAVAGFVTEEAALVAREHLDLAGQGAYRRGPLLRR